MNPVRVSVGLVLAVVGFMLAGYAFIVLQPVGPVGTLMAGLGGALIAYGILLAYRGFRLIPPRPD